MAERNPSTPTRRIAHFQRVADAVARAADDAAAHAPASGAPTRLPPGARTARRRRRRAGARRDRARQARATRVLADPVVAPSRARGRAREAVEKHAAGRSERGRRAPRASRSEEVERVEHRCWNFHDRASAATFDGVGGDVCGRGAGSTRRGGRRARRAEAKAARLIEAPRPTTRPRASGY